VNLLKSTTPDQSINAAYKGARNLLTYTLNRYVTEKINFACFLESTPEHYQANQLMVCQTVFKYNLQTTVWSHRLSRFDIKTKMTTDKILANE
jgi:hypothetical protein